MQLTSMFAARVIKDDKFQLFDVECVVRETKPVPGEMTCIRFSIVGKVTQNVKTLVLDNDFEMNINR